MRRLYQKIYLTIIATLIVVVAAAGAMWRLGADYTPAAQGFEMVGELVEAALPPADAPRAAQEQAINQLARRFDTDLALFDDSLNVIVAAGRPVRPPRGKANGVSYGPGGPQFSLRLPDGRWLAMRTLARPHHPALGLIIFLGTIALLVAACAYPVVRGLTGRIERLEKGVDTLGAGNLSARVKVEGKDEVARLAESFNRAAGRIEELVRAHRMLLANASHELRTPLSRIRMGLELIETDPDPARKAALKEDIAELDALVDEILLASRLDIAETLTGAEDIDLLALAAEEAARYQDVTVEGEPVTIKGDSRHIRRLIRNLLDNARRHGRPPVAIEVKRQGNQAILEVMDEGEGIPEAEREQVFQPFHRIGDDGRGAGLGLALVRRIARLHGGDALVAPRPARPSCFRVTLPF
jgi:two-component system, OmpR family, sensor histidine kinase RstB